MKNNMKRNNNSPNRGQVFDLITNKIMDIGKQVEVQAKKKSKTEIKKPRKIPKFELNLIQVMKEYHPLDVFKSILIAESWIPNLHSFIKFSLLFEIFFTISEEEFKNKRIKNYQEFSSFLNNIFKFLPHNPMIEDFSPVGDWGEVKYQFEGRSYKILYGTPLSDVYGFIKGLEICYSSNKQAMDDLRKLLEIQNNLISNIHTQKLSKDEEEKLEVPSDEFRLEFLNWLEHIHIGNINKDLIVKNGIVRKDSDFYERYMEAEVNPFCYFKYESKIYPFSLRNNISVIVEYYYSKEIINNEFLALNISNFINNNINNILCGAFRIRNNSKILPYTFSGVFQSEKNTYFVLPVSIQDLENFKNIKKDLKSLINKGDWGLQKKYSQIGLQPRNINGDFLKYEDINFIIVLTDLTSLPKFLNIKFEENINYIPIFEFISIFDSLESKEDLDKFIDFYHTNVSKALFLGFNLDGYASYKQSHGLLEDGAINFNLIHIDPHNSHYFKYEYLKDVYSDLPEYLPNNESNWIVKSTYDGNYCLLSKDYSNVVWSTSINKYNIHFLFDFNIVDNTLDILNPRVIELFCQAAADSFSQRKSFLISKDFKKNIVFKVKVGKYISKNSNETTQYNEFYTTNELIINNDDQLVINLFIDLNYCFEKFQESLDASFQYEIISGLLKIINNYYVISSLDDLLIDLEKTKKWPLRMTMGGIKARFDIIKIKSKEISEFRFKIARQKISYILKDKEIVPGKYTDVQLAKSIINDSADELRNYIHNIIKNRNTISILELALTDYSAIITDNYIDTLQQKHSLKHQVSYNRAERLAEIDNNFIRNSQNYRYFIECALMLSNNNSQKITEDEYLDLLAHIHWLLNLYHSSDGLHFGIGVEGINVDNAYIPEISIPDSITNIETKYHEELSSYKLGIGLNSDDELESIIPQDEYKLINDAFYKDLSFGFRNLITVLYCLSNWATFNHISPQAYYQVELNELIQTIFNHFTIKDVTFEEVGKIIEFLIIDNEKINQLEGVDRKHYDVPVGDHNKRTNRINIKPLIKIGERIIWSPVCTHRSLGIWTNHTTDGYLPADFNFRNVNKLVKNSKTVLEKQLETKAFNILLRRSSFVKRGLDLRKTFYNQEDYPDIGDYDVLAYFPESNNWVMIECKYNQPAYCIKDMNRLRHKIFGKDELDQSSHISKVQGRYKFLISNYDRIRKSLNWPLPAENQLHKVTNLYISKNTYWWFRYPPYAVNVDFVQVDFLEQWLKENFDFQIN